MMTQAEIDEQAEVEHARLREQMACKDCPSEVRVTCGTRGDNIRVIHQDTCPWWRRFQSGEVRASIPCGCRVTHRGPYKRKQASEGSAA